MDSDLRRCLQELTGDTKLWADFQPSTLPGPNDQDDEDNDAMSNAAPPQQKIVWKETDLNRGDVSEEGLELCPWDLVTKYPDVFAGKTNGKLAQPLFTLEALHEPQVWDFYYLHRPNQPATRDPDLFVPTYQVQHLLDIVNYKLGIHFTIPPGPDTRKFKIVFPLTTPRPRFLGRSSCEDAFHDLKEDYPPCHGPNEDPGKATEQDRKSFLKILACLNMARSLTKKSDASRFNRLERHRGWGLSIKRVQRYLGLRHRKRVAVPATITTADVSKTLDLNRPLSPKPEETVRLVAIDLEAYELDLSLVTEVGVAILDTDKLIGVAPGNGGRNWFPLIEARHYRIKENDWAINTTFVQGHPESFGFGESEIVPLAEMPAILADIFSQSRVNERPRQVVPVFHNAKSDINFLFTLGYDLYQAPNMREFVDTEKLNSYNTREPNAMSLGNILSRLSITCENLHNAGNDAVYTMHALIGLAIERRLQSLCVSEVHERDQGWTSDENEDGGEPGPVEETVNDRTWRPKEV